MLLNISQMDLFYRGRVLIRTTARSKTWISGISRIFSPTFINLTFLYSAVVKYENLDV